MHSIYRAFSLLTCTLLFAFPLLSREVSPVVSTGWLAQNLTNPKVIVVDIRSGVQYQKGHIPGAVHVPFENWTVTDNQLAMELPSDEVLRELIARTGIGNDSIVVVVNDFGSDFSRADATRVAWTCIVAGVKNTAVLDGGYDLWMKDNRSVTTDPVRPDALEYSGHIDRSLVVLKNDVLHKIGESIIVDNRTPEDYFGITSEPGHIKSAVNLPTPWVYSSDGRFRNKEVLQKMASGVVGSDKSEEVIVYCGVGGYASTWWFLLTQMLGYQNVRLYDGSIQEWIADPDAPVETYRWD